MIFVRIIWLNFGERYVKRCCVNMIDMMSRHVVHTAWSIWIMNRNHAFRRISHYIGNDTSCGYSRLPSCRRMSGSAEFLPRPNIRRKHCGRRKRRRIYKFRSAAAKTSANLELSLPVLLTFRHSPNWLRYTSSSASLPVESSVVECMFSSAGLMANGRIYRPRNFIVFVLCVIITDCFSD